MFEFVETGTYPTREGNAVYPLIDGVPAFRRICEVIESSRTNVFATITFMWPDFAMPAPYGTALQVLENAAKRGVRVHLIFWRPEAQMASHKKNAFWGSPEHRELLSTQYPNLNIRWDMAAPGYCQHQKSWLIDAATENATAFVGGINLNPNSVVEPGHPPRPDISHQNHDAYVELRGPAVADVHHNFVQRWNEASERHQQTGKFGEHADEDLAFPTTLPPECGSALVQMQRTTHKDLYSNGHPAVNGERFEISSGERTNLEQYCATIRSAQRTLYIENQYIEVEPIVTALREALSKGVEVLVVLPVTPDYSLRGDQLNESRLAFLRARAALAEFPNFMLCGLATREPSGHLTSVYVHSKLMVADGVAALVGSCNLHHYSLYGNGELNATVHDSAFALELLRQLFLEHVAMDQEMSDDLQAIKFFKATAAANRAAGANREWCGIAFEMDISTYGTLNPLDAVQED